MGKIFAIYSLAPLVIAIVLFTLFVSRRDLHTATLSLGVILNHLLNQVILCVCVTVRVALVSLFYLCSY